MKKLNIQMYLVNSTMTQSMYKTANFLIYSYFESQMPVAMGGSTIGGSLLIDSALTEEEANEKITMYKARGEDFQDRFPLSKQKTQYCFIKNDMNWWR